ncbi:MAG: NAD-dependent protein deacetylase [Myxococcota bacterium]
MEQAIIELARSLPGRVVALVGAGCSTDSGIPDYRGEGTARRARNPAQHLAFVQDPLTRRRYWARSFRGWPLMAATTPNVAHHTLAELEARGKLSGIITQNVDGLHHAAESQRIIELHGALRRVRCLDCGSVTSRSSLQARFAKANPTANPAPILLADGDADVTSVDDFQVVDCAHCGGTLMPDMVFFGGTVPRERVDEAYQWVDEADGLLVVGSSLTVFSGYRFVKRALSQDKPVGIINLGQTRADRLARVKVEAPLGVALPALAKTWATEQVSESA